MSTDKQAASAKAEKPASDKQAVARPLDEAPRTNGYYLNTAGDPVDANGEPIKD